MGVIVCDRCYYHTIRRADGLIDVECFIGTGLFEF